MPEETRPILVRLEVEWEKSNGKFCKCGYRGGYDYHGSPNILYQGGFGSPDFDMTLDEIKARVREALAYTKRKVIIKVIVKRDDRNPKISQYF